jgi:predicted acylesterase/phospholipase RssA
MTETRFANLALQGGGAHGAFTWGVLDRLLKELRFEIDGISATSAGAINAVVLAHGLTVGGRDGAINALANFWQQVAVISTWLGSNQRSIFRPSTHERGSRPIIVDPEPEEAKAPVGGAISYFGTYSVDETTKTITLRTEASSFPNQLGRDQNELSSLSRRTAILFQCLVAKNDVAMKRAK